MKTNEIVDVLIGKIKTLPNGTEITTSQLVKLCGLESECNSDGFFEPMGLFEIHNALFKAAEKRVFSIKILLIFYLIFKVDKASNIKIIPTIQNLTITLGSATPLSSK